MEKNCTKCKKKHIINEKDYKPNGKDVYKFCIKCREKNTKETINKKYKLIEKAIKKNKCYCLRCQIPLNYEKTKLVSYCELCRDYTKEFIAKKREMNKSENTCTRCCKTKDNNNYKTCSKCREIDRKSSKNRVTKKNYN